MAQFISFAPNVEVNGETVLTMVNAFPDYIREVSLQYLAENGIKKPKPGRWYSQQAWLDCFRQISLNFGPSTLFQIGKNIPQNAQFPADINSLEKALSSINIAYKMNHRKGEIGYYKLLRFDAANQQAYMECKNPYPCHFDRGIITAMVRKYNPSGYPYGVVELEPQRVGRLNGANASCYIIKW